LRRAGNSTSAFEIKLSPQAKSVLLDAARFEAALLNLVVNARDAMPDGGKLCIITENVQFRDGEVGKLTAGEYVRISVVDTGIGMPPEIVGRVFEPFFTTKEIGKGTGLGLSQVYGFITQSGGEITVQSEVGKGTVINLYLAAESNDDSKVSESESHTEIVLIVEDEPDVLEVASQLFQSIGYDILTASNGKDAIDILQRNTNIDVLFTDVMMPHGMSGIELARKTRKLSPHTKIILASGYPLPALKNQHGDLDEFIFMNKPYRLSELAKKLRMAA
jgi:CheY-like chemotaxis protein